MKKLLLLILLWSNVSGWAQCAAYPYGVTNPGATSAVFNFGGSEDAESYEVYVTVHESPAPEVSSTPTQAVPTSPAMISGLICGIEYDVYVRAVCASGAGDWSQPMTFQTINMGILALMPMVQGDDDEDGIVIFDLTTIQGQINSATPLTYYTSLADAVAEENAIFNPAAFPVSVQQMTVPIFVNQQGDPCATIHSFSLIANINPNAAVACANANSLCGSLNVSFPNTFNGPPMAESGNDYNCLGTQPNPTWFYIPVSLSGQITLEIRQNMASGLGLDVDYICYGPFTSATGACGGLNQNNTVSCSYSTAAVETFNIINAQQGQYYLLLVTNFSNQPGIIQISQLNENMIGAGAIDCTGMKFHAFLDGNGNSTLDVGEAHLPIGSFEWERNNNGVIHTVSSQSGILNLYETNVSTTYEVSFAIATPYAANYNVPVASISDISVTPGSAMTDYYFPVTVAQAYVDTAVDIVMTESPRAGFDYETVVLYRNNGTSTIASGTVSFVAAPETTIISTSEPGASTTSGGFTFDFTDLQPFETREIIVTLSVPPIPEVELGDLLTHTASLTIPEADINPANNSFTSSHTVIGSYDPNDIAESHGERILISSFDSSDYLYYTVRFENTGSAPAINVRVTETLDAKIDETTLEMIHASHPYTLTRTGSQLTWEFDNIELPFSSQDAEAAKGYIHFRVKPDPGFTVGTIIPATAAIYFDYNPAIVTNTWNTQFVQTLAVAHHSTGFSIYPNPASSTVNVSLVGPSATITQVTIRDLLGKSVYSKNVSSADVQIDCDLASGIYLVEVITSENVRHVNKLIRK